MRTKPLTPARRELAKQKSEMSEPLSAINTIRQAVLRAKERTGTKSSPPKRRNAERSTDSRQFSDRLTRNCSVCV